MKENKVISLIATLNQGEKRHFSKIIKQSHGEDLPLFYQLFQIYDKYGAISDKEIVHINPSIKSGQIHNLRSQLYLHLLRSLRQLNIKNSIEIEIREKIDFAHVLNSKGFYTEALEQLHKVKQVALKQNRNVLALEILFFERSIELQNITKSIGNRAHELVEETNELVQRIDRIKDFSTVDLELYAYYLKHGFCTSQEELLQVEQAFKAVLQKKPQEGDNFYMFLYYYQSLCWYHYIRQEFDLYFEAAELWVNLFDQEDEMRRLRPALYLKGLHNVITAAFLAKRYHAFRDFVRQLNKIEENTLRRNELSMMKLYQHMHALDDCFFTGDFASYKALDTLENLMATNPFHWDNHRLAVFHYKLGCLYFGINNYEVAAEHFLRVSQHLPTQSKSPIKLFSKILLALAHVQFGNFRLVNSQVKALQNQLSKEKEGKDLERVLVRLISRLLAVPQNERLAVLQKTLEELNILKDKELLNIGFIHFYAMEWIEGQIQDVEACRIIQNGFNELKRKTSNFVGHE